MVTVGHSLLLLIGVLSIVPVFCRLVGGGSLGRVRHGGEVVGHRDAAGEDPFHGRGKASGSHAHDARWVSEEDTERASKSGAASCRALGSACFGGFIEESPFTPNARRPLREKSKTRMFTSR